jgi:hypothetical protein
MAIPAESTKAQNEIKHSSWLPILIPLSYDLLDIISAGG